MNNRAGVMPPLGFTAWQSLGAIDHRESVSVMKPSTPLVRPGVPMNFLHKDRHITSVLRKSPGQRLLQLELCLRLPWHETRNYEFSKLYFKRPSDTFSESNVICFRVRYRDQPERLRILLPEHTKAWSGIVFRIDALPYAKGQFDLYDLRLCDPDSDGEDDAVLTRNARALAQKEWVRKQVEISESQLRNFVPHYPESLGLELTPNCNFTCGHCSSHGTPELHHAHNKMPAMSVETLRKLSEEVFPHLTVISVVGRGETTMVSNALWSEFVTSVTQNSVFVSLVTNAYDLKRKVTKDLLPLIDTLTISIDGNTSAVFAENRGGASLAHTLEEVAYYNDLRKGAGLARRPKLCISWTLKRNNIAEFPEFIRTISKFEPDLIYARHLLVFHEKDRDQMLHDIPGDANRYLSEAYGLMRDYGIRSECPPLFDLSSKESRGAQDVGQDALSNQEPTARPSPELRTPVDVPDRCIWIHRTGTIMSGGEIATCGRHYAATAGKLAESSSFFEIWNGSEMLDLRGAFGTSSEWEQCSNCWYRESHYDNQRAARAKNEDFALDGGTSFSVAAWDFRGYETSGKQG